MQQPWFDTLEGKLIVGDAAYEQALEQSFPGDIRPLGELLLAETFEFGTGSFIERGVQQHLGPDEKQALGKWAIAVLESHAGKPVMLKGEHLDRLHWLGLSPDKESVMRPFGGADGYRAAIGSPLPWRGKHGRFARMSDEELLQHMQSIIEERGYGPCDADYDDPRWPTDNMLDRRFGGRGRLSEHLGRVYTRELDKDDYIDWGVAVIKANGKDRFVPLLIRALTRRQAGPDLHTIQSHFVRWSIFKEAAVTEHDQRQEYELQSAADKRERYDLWYELHKLPRELKGQPDEYAAIGRYLLVDKFGIMLTTKQKLELALPNSKNFMSKLLSTNEALSAGDIESYAVARQVFDDIWPPQGRYPDLHVPEDELATLRERHSANQRASARRQQERKAS